MSDDFVIRPAAEADAEELLNIYAHYVKNTAVTFDYEVPGADEFRARMRRTMEKYPYFVAVGDGGPLGYAYAGPFVGRAAYDWSAELTIYLDPERKGHGAGRALYEALQEALAAMGITNLYACIGSPETPDEYLDDTSEAFHAHMGFVRVGRFRRCGYKFGRWYDMIWMEKIIGEHTAAQKPVIPWPEI